jgi:glycosyltransferase involved in cell wall biosynthesis
VTSGASAAHPSCDALSEPRQRRAPPVAAVASLPTALRPARRLTVIITVPTVDTGAADVGAIELVRILVEAGHRAIVVSSGGRLEPAAASAGAELVRLDTASKNPLVIIRNGLRLAGLVRSRGCDILHAHGRTAGWSALIAARMTGTAFVTSWYKGFREQNFLKRVYNGVMARGDRVIAVGDQMAELIAERHHAPENRITVIPATVDVDRFDPAAVSADRVDAVRAVWGARRDTKVIVVVGRMLRRKGHDVVVRAARRLKEIGLKDFLFVFVGEDQGRSRYTGEVWDLVLATDTTDVIRLNPIEDLPAALASATVAVSAATQPEGLQHAVLEALAMQIPVVVSDLAAGPDVVLAPPAVTEDRITGLRVASGDDAALAAAVIRIFSMPEPTRQAIGARGREWVLAQFDQASIAAQTLALYDDIVAR